MPGEKLLDLLTRGAGENDDLVEASPQRRVEQSLMIGRGDGESLGMKAVEQLEERVDYPLQLAVFIRRGSLLADRVEFIEQEDEWT